MNATQWILIGWLVLSGLIVFVKGVAGVTRTYTGWDALFAVIEIGAMVWLVASL